MILCNLKPCYNLVNDFTCSFKHVQLTLAVLEICKPATVFDKTKYTIDFSSFETTSESRCQCSFVAPTSGSLQLSPYRFTGITSGCATKIEVRVNGNTYSGGSTECRADPMFDAVAQTGAWWRWRYSIHPDLQGLHGTAIKQISQSTVTYCYMLTSIIISQWPNIMNKYQTYFGNLYLYIVYTVLHLLMRKKSYFYLGTK